MHDNNNTKDRKGYMKLKYFLNLALLGKWQTCTAKTRVHAAAAHVDYRTDGQKSVLTNELTEEKME